MRAGVILLFGILVPLAGCSDARPKGALAVFPVSGTLTYKGAPMVGARVTFHPVGSDKAKISPIATADASGRYTLTSYLTDDGAPAGEYTVTVHWPVDNYKPPANDPDPPLPPDRLKNAYTNPAKSNLKYTVKSEPNTIDINIP